MKDAERGRLHVSKLEAFKAFCERCGYVNMTPIEEASEVLRMYRPGAKGVLVVHRRVNAQHCTTWGASETMRIVFQRERNAARINELFPHGNYAARG